MKIFFNTKDYAKADDAEIRAFLRYVNGEYSENSFVKKLDTRVKQVKENMEWRAEYMTLLMREQEIREEAFEKGINKGKAEGRAEEKAETIAKMYKNSISITDIAKILEIAEEEVKAYLKV